MKHEVVDLTAHEIERERWKDIPGYEGIYQASDMGRVRSAPGKTTQNKLHGTCIWKTRVLKYRGITPKTGYRVNLWKDKKPKDFLVARLVAMTWLGVSKDNMTVNHIDGNRFNNRVANLEWVSLADNIRHAFETGLMPTIPVILLDEDRRPTYFRSQAEASRWLGKSDTYINTVLARGESATCGYTIFTA